MDSILYFSLCFSSNAKDSVSIGSMVTTPNDGDIRHQQGPIARKTDVCMATVGGEQEIMPNGNGKCPGVYTSALQPGERYDAATAALCRQDKGCIEKHVYIYVHICGVFRSHEKTGEAETQKVDVLAQRRCWERQVSYLGADRACSRCSLEDTLTGSPRETRVRTQNSTRITSA